MCRKATAFAVSLFFIFSTAFAETLETHTFEFSPELSYKEYKEPTMSDRGIFLGLNGSYTYHKDLMARLSLLVSVGDVDYEGSGQIDKIPEYLFEARGLLGKDLILPEEIITPYVGFGYRYLYEDLGGLVSTTGAWGYDRKSEYFYIPIGVEAVGALNENTALKAGLEYDYFIRGTQTSYLSDVSSYYIDVENTQNTGYGVRGFFAIQKTGMNSIEFGPFFRYWNIEKSNLTVCTVDGAYVCWEPENETTELGVRLSAKF